jgi:type IV pilus assembly protein PilY1
MKWINKLATPLVLAIASFIIVGSTAQTPPMPGVLLDIGPVAVNQQAVNIALSLSVEFPTVGSAYRRADYEHNTTYLGYFDPNGCYSYFDTTSGAPLGGEYFVRRGTVDSSKYCNTAASATRYYSGNVLNYVTTSSIDLLRYALTGGDRVADTANTTVLGRAYLYNSWNLHNGTYFPSKRIPATYVGKITPNHGNIDIYGGGCWNRVWFGTSNASQPCDNPGTSGNLNNAITDPTAFTTVAVAFGAPAPTGGTFSTTVFVVTSPLQTTSVAPAEGPITFTDVTVLGSGTGTTVPPGFTAGATFLYTQYTVNGTTSTTAPASPEPTVVVGTTTAVRATRIFQSFVPTSGPYRTFTFTSNSTNVCRITNSATTASFIGSLTSAGAVNGVSGSNCGNGLYTGYTFRGNVSTVPRTVYEPLDAINVYARHTATPVYKNYTIRTDYHVYNKQDEYTLPGTRAGVMYARVKVCDSTEDTTRTDLCKRYPDGNYKPVGEIQNKAEGVRVAAFGYLKDDTTSRYGGTLRAPMKYPGPTYRDPNGVLQTNSETQWNANNGIFTTDPLGAAPTYTQSGAVNYLNKFGTSGATQGYYKGFDPVGELYYEVLRYFQGLDPTPSASASLDVTPTLADGFPVYLPTTVGANRWVDPLQNACERKNFILQIGDVNTHRDRQLPGHNGSLGNDAAADPARAVAIIPGPDTSKTFDAVYWTERLTGFETNISKSYTDAQGRAQTTLGNPNPNSNNSGLHTTGTGSGGTSAHYWAGAAYWANTQPIRYDSKAGQSMKDVRVKTFTIDVDEGGNGDIEDTNVRGIKPRRSSFYLAGKYGWFDDANRDGNPFSTTGGATNNSEWEDPLAANTPNGYVIASQAQKLIEGIRKFFSAASNEKGAVSVSALSSQRFTSSSPNGDIFVPRFDTRDWSGTVERTGLILNTNTLAIEASKTTIWDAGKILTTASVSTSATLADPYVAPALRKIFTYARSGSTAQGVQFDVAHKSSLDAAVQTALDANPATNTADGLADQRINWLRGDRSNEQTSTGGAFRRRNSILGDIINSGPVYKQAADPDIQGDGYVAFVASKANRTATVYVGANDGMLHAFRANDGKELFAYMPRAVSTDVNKLTNPNYVHRPYVDGVPIVGEAKVGNNWKTVLASGFGGGAQGVFALDVSDPTLFDTGNVMFEFTDQDDADMGNVLTQPKIVQLKIPGATSTSPFTYKWFLAVGSGYNNYRSDSYTSTGNGAQAMFFLSLDKSPSDAWTLNSNYFKVVVPATNTTSANGLANPGLILGQIGETNYLYAGDLQGNLWKFDLSSGIDATKIANAVFKSSGTAKPIFVATNTAGGLQPITTSPIAVAANSRGYMVVFGTGKFVEPGDTTTAGVQSIYGIWDSEETTAAKFTTPKNKLFQRTATEGSTSVSITTATFAYGFNTGQYRGWFVELPGARERIAVEGSVDIGFVAFNSTIPDGSCSGDGNGRTYLLNPVFGTLKNTVQVQTNVGLLSRPNPIEIDTGAYSTRDPRGFRTVRLNQSIVSSGTLITEGGGTAIDTQKTNSSVEIPGGRLSWRELRN